MIISIFAQSFYMRYLFLRLLLGYFLFFQISFVVTAQKDLVAERVINQIDSTFVSNFKSFSNRKVSAKPTEFISFLSTTDVTPSPLFSDKEYLLAKQKQLRSDIGLSFNSSYLGNKGTGVFNLEDNLIMKSRFQTGLELDLLQGGLFENRSKAKALSYQMKFSSQLQTTLGNKDAYLKRFNLIIQIFNKQKLALLQKRNQLVGMLMQNEQHLFNKRLLKKEDILETQQRNAQVKALMHIYEPYNTLSSYQVDSSIYATEINAFDINQELLLSRLQGKISDSLKYFLEREAAISSRWINDIRLSAFSRYNYYDMTASADRSFYSYGVNLGIPIPLGRNKDLKVRKLELTKQIEDVERQKQFYSEELLNELYEFRYKLQQYITFEYKKQTFDEQLRLEDVKRSLSSKYYSPLKALKLVDDLYAIEMELLELKQNMYLKLIRIQEKVPSMSMQELVTPLNLPSMLNDGADIYRSMYVWSSIFQDYDANYLFQYLKYHKMNNVLIAYQREDDFLTKKKLLINLLVNNQQSVEIMIGQNNLLFETDLKRWFGSVFKQYENVTVVGYHLDVEPHALKEWKLNQENKDILLKKYVQLLKQSSELLHAKGLKLTVSIPLHYPTEIVEEIYSLVDGVYFMCYENVGIDYLVRKLAPYKEYQEKTHIALRTEDFPYRKAMEDHGSVLIELTGCKNIVYHDLKRMILLDAKELKR